MIFYRNNGTFLLLAGLASVAVVNAWMPRSSVPRRLSSFQGTTITSSKTVLAAESGIPDISGKDIYQRAFYRLTPYSEVDDYDAIIVEERVRFKPDEAKGEGSLKPVGPRTLILRDGKVEDGEIGDELFEINVKESLKSGVTHAGAGRDSAVEATIATILFLAANPKYIEGKVLELGCGTGLAGLLGAIGAKALRAGGDAKKDSSTPGADEAPMEDILSIPKGTALTDELKMITLTDEEVASLELALANAQLSGVPSTQLNVEELKWRTRSLNRASPKVFHTVLASDLNYNYPEAKELAHTVAHRLEAFSSWQLNKGESKSPPTFLHVCPDAREDVSYLHKFLDQGYRMNVHTGYVKLEKLLFAFQMLPESEPEEKLDDLELEVQESKEVVYLSLTAEHHPEYADGAGEYFFPMETGEYDTASGSTYLEPESDGSKWY